MAKQRQNTNSDRSGRDQENPENNEQKSGKSVIGEKTKWILLITSILIAMAGTVVLAKFVLWPQYKKFQQKREQAKKEEEKKQVNKLGPIYTIGELTVNPYGSNGLRFVIAEVALEVKNEDMIEELEKREPQIKDLLIRYFRERSTNQILNPNFQDSSAVALRSEINKRLFKSQIDSLYYLKLVVQ
ncbi:MAG TPA: flagellar basal body-associated FliL family protein [bacterium]|nr:flagellar basal body-associated FliL family protein [bacterium]